MFDVEWVLGELTVEEKAALVSGSDFWHTVGVERLGVPAVMCSDGPHGLRAQMDAADHVGLAGSVPATCFPTASAIASSWDVDVLHEVGAAIGVEARRWNVSIVLGPGVNIKRSPLCGRNFEYLSEDPFLAGELGVAIVDGIQSRGVGTSVKHFAANNQEDDRLRVSADVDERTLREIYLPAFEQIAKRAAPWTVMCAYNKVNGTYASEHHWLLTEVLRDEWGWDGVVVSDWGACHDRVAALRAGLDWEMPPDLARSPEAVRSAIDTGELDIAVLDRSVRRMLEMIDRSAGVFDTDDSFDEAAHHQLARRAAAESIVLLKNDGGLLPIGAGSVAVIGEFARTPRFQGAGSSQVNPTRVDRIVDELERALGADRVRFGAGYSIEGSDDDERLRQEAIARAAECDTVVCVLGLPAWYESEGFDRTHMELPDNQLALLDAVTAANPRVVVVLVNGSTIRTSHWEHSVPAIVEAWLGGQAAGGAIADVLAGVVNPSGRLAETIPVALNDVPSTLNFPGDSGHVRYGEGLFVGYRAHDRLEQPVSYAFGHGLSYTTFDYGDDVTIERAGSADTGDLSVTVEIPVTNTGDRPGAETVQVYVRDLESSVVRPARELKGFTKVRLEPDQTATVKIELDQRAFSFWSDVQRSWVVEAGEFVIEVGASSRDIRSSAHLTIDAASIAPPLTPMSTLHEWLADPRGSTALHALTSLAPVLAQHDLVSVIGTMPLDTLASFPDFGLDHHQLDELIQTIGPDQR